MPMLSSLMTDIRSMNNDSLEELLNYIGEVMTFNTISSDMPKQCRDSRFSQGKCCFHCKSSNIIKFGKTKGKQRFKCKDCGRTFNDYSCSPLTNTKLNIRVWVKYAKCMLSGYSIRKSAEVVEVGVKTSFYMRHRLLDAIRNYMSIGNVDGVVEMDETFLAESFKGNHKKSGFVMGRPPRKRGKEVKKRGISKEQVCIATAIDRNNNVVMEMVCKGRVSHKDLERLYSNHISKESIICTDSHKSYIRFSKNLSLNHVQILRGRHKNGIYNLARINSFHSGFKKWLKRFNGVSTKFLANYLHWFKWLKCFEDDKELIRNKNFIVHSVTKATDTRILNYRGRQPAFV
jgi:transposase-like protein